MLACGRTLVRVVLKQELGQLKPREREIWLRWTDARRCPCSFRINDFAGVVQSSVGERPSLERDNKLSTATYDDWKGRRTGAGRSGVATCNPPLLLNEFSVPDILQEPLRGQLTPQPLGLARFVGGAGHSKKLQSLTVTAGRVGNLFVCRASRLRAV